jgi:hypothetical protein
VFGRFFGVVLQVAGQFGIFSSSPLRLKVPAIGKMLATLFLMVICASGDEPKILKSP